MKILVTGVSGLLGSHLAARLSARHSVAGTDRHAWWGDLPLRLIPGDLTDASFLRKVAQEVQPEAVIHCAAVTDVDACEKDPAMACRINADATRELARAVPPESLFVYVSTDALFSGDRPFSAEEEAPLPRTAYARSKLQGEWEVRIAAKNHLIVRTNFYGWSSGRKKTSAEWMFAVLEKEEPVTFFDDWFFTPIYVADLAERIQALLEAGARGVFHAAGSERVSKAGFGLQMAELAGFSTRRVRVASMEEAPLLAARARDTSLDSGRCARATGLPSPTCRRGLTRFLRHRNRALSARFGGEEAVEGRRR